MNNQATVRAFQDWQIINLVQTNKDKTAEEIAIISGINKSKIYRIIREYNAHGKTWKPYDNWGGRREKRCLFSLAEEAEILKEIEEDALLDKILIYKHVKTIIEKMRISPFQMIMYGIYLKGMVGVKKSHNDTILNETNKNK